MFRFIVGIFTGIYLAQEYPRDVPSVNHKINYFLAEFGQKSHRIKIDDDDPFKKNK